MFKKFSLLAVAVLATTLAFSAAAQETKVLTIASGAKGGTYDIMVTQMAAKCSNDVMIRNVNSTGSVQNIDIILGNVPGVSANAVLGQLDAVRYKSNTEDGMAKVKVLATMHPEAVHLVGVNTSYKGEKSGTDKLMFWKSAPVYTFNTLGDLDGQVIGAAGGSYVTARSIQVNGQYKFTVQQFNTNDEVMAALKQGVIRAALFVGGHPLPIVSGLGQEFKLLPLGPDDLKKVSEAYKGTKVTYPNLGAQGVATIFTNSALLGIQSNNANLNAAYSALRTCLQREIPNLQDGGGAKSWNNVAADQFTNPENRGKWAWLELPATGVKAPAAKK